VASEGSIEGTGNGAVSAAGANGAAGTGSSPVGSTIGIGPNAGTESVTSGSSTGGGSATTGDHSSPRSEAALVAGGRPAGSDASGSGGVQFASDWSDGRPSSPVGSSSGASSAQS